MRAIIYFSFQSVVTVLWFLNVLFMASFAVSCKQKSGRPAAPEKKRRLRGRGIAGMQGAEIFAAGMRLQKEEKR
jgi:hypothetical protein